MANQTFSGRIANCDNVICRGNSKKKKKKSPTRVRGVTGNKFELRREKEFIRAVRCDEIWEQARFT